MKDILILALCMIGGLAPLCMILAGEPESSPRAMCLWMVMLVLFYSLVYRVGIDEGRRDR